MYPDQQGSRWLGRSEDVTPPQDGPAEGKETLDPGEAGAGGFSSSPKGSVSQRSLPADRDRQPRRIETVSGIFPVLGIGVI